jgi:hypothetical protein
MQAAAARQTEIDEQEASACPARNTATCRPGLAWPEQERRQRAAVHQPPHREIAASERITAEYKQRARDNEPEIEREAE